MLREERSGEVGAGMFYEDKALLRASLEKVAASEPRTIYLSHSDPIDNRALKRAIAAL
jgi:hypothetical protein